MQLNKIIDDYFVSEQITENDINLLKEKGFKTIFCNRPDHEEQNQSDAKNIQKMAASHGIKFIHQPVVGTEISLADVDDFSAHYNNAEKPILAYCKTGTRCSMLWALSESSNRPIDEILNLTTSAGYDLSSLFK